MLSFLRRTLGRRSIHKHAEKARQREAQRATTHIPAAGDAKSIITCRVSLLDGTDVSVDLPVSRLMHKCCTVFGWLVFINRPICLVSFSVLNSCTCCDAPFFDWVVKCFSWVALVKMCPWLKLKVESVSVFSLYFDRYSRHYSMPERKLSIVRCCLRLKTWESETRHHCLVTTDELSTCYLTNEKSLLSTL